MNYTIEGSKFTKYRCTKLSTTRQVVEVRKNAYNIWATILHCRYKWPTVVQTGGINAGWSRHRGKTSASSGDHLQNLAFQCKMLSLRCQVLSRHYHRPALRMRWLVRRLSRFLSSLCPCFNSDSTTISLTHQGPETFQIIGHIEGVFKCRICCVFDCNSDESECKWNVFVFE